MRRRSFVTFLTTALLLGVIAYAPVAGAAPVDDKKKQAAALEAEINTNAEHIAVLSEQLKAAQDKLDHANQTMADAQARIAAARAEADRLTELVSQRAAAAYRSATKGGDAGFFEVDAEALSSREKYASAASERDDALLQQLDAARSDLDLVQRDAAEAKSAAETEKAALESMKAEYDAGQAERQRLLGQVQGELKTLVDQAAHERAAKESPAGFDASRIPPVGGGAGSAVNFAVAQLGKPYCDTNPQRFGMDCFDCSGLTSSAWAYAGVTIPATSESQYGGLPKVPMDQIQPGDILWRPNHVGIYVGNGTVVHATHPGSTVSTIGVGYFEGAVRPG
jgi:peptidoglycan DL-endopeptidase CwlO